MRDFKFTNNEFYHIYNRGVEKRSIFSQQRDYYRFISCLFEFNSIVPSTNHSYHFNFKNKENIRNSTPLIEIMAFCLMPNHFHLLAKQAVDNGITIFMRKLGTGYTNYFNLKYERVGPLFQGKFKAKHIDNDSYMFYLPHYIHLNPLEITTPSWQENSNNIDSKKLISQLKSYKWNSLSDYLGKSNFPGLVSTEFITDLYRSPTSITSSTSTTNYENHLDDWIKNFSLDSIKEVVID